ncbi:hypothetical protein [Bosea sp. LC85]|uniref:hypothetical protein n=1 Tax=Bosea sp. LC85 TaxID=1502851 RepID=UPI001269F9DA|nr:hypothetical protein [Bosea sp. LC85]
MTIYQFRNSLFAAISCGVRDKSKPDQSKRMPRPDCAVGPQSCIELGNTVAGTNKIINQHNKPTFRVVHRINAGMIQKLARMHTTKAAYYCGDTAFASYISARTDGVGLLVRVKI